MSQYINLNSFKPRSNEWARFKADLYTAQRKLHPPHSPPPLPTPPNPSALSPSNAMTTLYSSPAANRPQQRCLSSRGPENRGIALDKSPLIALDVQRRRSHAAPLPPPLPPPPPPCPVEAELLMDARVLPIR